MFRRGNPRVLWPLQPHVKWIATGAAHLRDDDGNSICLILLKNLLNLRMVENALRLTKRERTGGTIAKKNHHRYLNICSVVNRNRWPFAMTTGAVTVRDDDVS